MCVFNHRPVLFDLQHVLPTSHILHYLPSSSFFNFLFIITMYYQLPHEYFNPMVCYWRLKVLSPTNSCTNSPQDVFLTLRIRSSGSGLEREQSPCFISFWPALSAITCYSPSLTRTHNMILTIHTCHNCRTVLLIIWWSRSFIDHQHMLLIINTYNRLLKRHRGIYILHINIIPITKHQHASTYATPIGICYLSSDQLSACMCHR